MPKVKGIEVTESQAEVYKTLRSRGAMPDCVLVPLTQHISPQHQSSSGIRTRRRELVDKGLVVPTGKKIKTANGRSAAEYKAVR